MKLGVIGVGHLAEALLAGLARHGGIAPQQIMLSPRGKGPELARSGGHALAKDNAALVAACDVVLLCVRPADAVTAVASLPWRREQLLLSACAGTPITALRRAGVVAQVVRIMPIIAAQYGASPTLVYPMQPPLAPLLDAWGSTIALQEEAQFEVATTSAAMFGWVQAMIGTGAEWSHGKGLPADQARLLLAQTFAAAAVMVRQSDRSIPDLLDSIATPGGITEAGLRHLRARGVEPAWQEACDLVLQRLAR